MILLLLAERLKLVRNLTWVKTKQKHVVTSWVTVLPA